MANLPDILLLVFIVNLGTAFGAGLYEARIVIPRWFPKKQRDWYQIDKRAMYELDSGRKFWAGITTIPLTLLTITNLIYAWQSQEIRHDWWLTAALLVLIERIATFTFFIPTVIKLQKTESPPDGTLHQRIATWIHLNYVRNLITLLACLCALLALSQ